MIAYCQGFAVNWFTQFNTVNRLFLIGQSGIIIKVKPPFISKGLGSSLVSLLGLKFGR